MDAEATWPAWSKSRERIWEKRVALPFMMVGLFPKASRRVYSACHFSAAEYRRKGHQEKQGSSPHRGLQKYEGWGHLDQNHLKPDGFQGDRAAREKQRGHQGRDPPPRPALPTPFSVFPVVPVSPENTLFPLVPAMVARYCTRCWQLVVLPLPLLPRRMMDWSWRLINIALYAV